MGKVVKYIYCVCVYIYIYKERERERECIKDLNVRPNTIKLLQENIHRTLFDVKSSNIAFGIIKAIETKAKQMETN